MTTIKQVIRVPKDSDFYAVFKGDDGAISVSQIFFFALTEDVDEEGVFTGVEGLVLAEGYFELTGSISNCLGIYRLNEMREKFPNVHIL